MCILRELYGSGAERLRVEHMDFTVSHVNVQLDVFDGSLQTPSKKKLEISTVSSNHHIEINPR